MISPYRINFTIITVFLLALLIVILTGINKSLFLIINFYAAITNSFIWANLTFLGDTLPACIFMLLFIRKRPDLVWSGIIAAIIALIIVNSLKYFTGIMRPPAVIDKEVINIIGPAIIRRSFPSGHTVTIFTLTGIMLFYFRSIYVRLSLILLALLVGISRIAVGVHWPVDVLAGAAFGSMFAVSGVYFVKRLRWNKNRTMQIITGTILILAGLYMLCFYDSKYSQAIYLQYFIASAVLVAGLREYYLLLKPEQN
jgi:membrane-associated phospholipid phosphatase